MDHCLYSALCFQICLIFGFPLAVNRITKLCYSVNVEPVGTLRISGVAFSSSVFQCGLSLKISA